LVGCFLCGLVPSGSADPLGLRRAAIGLLTIMLDQAEALPINVSDCFTFAASAYPLDMQAGAVWDNLRSFMEQRLRGILIDAGADASAVDVALGADNDASRNLDPVDIRARALALEVVPSQVRVAFKRISNILDDARLKNEPVGKVDDTAFVADAEKNLWRVFNQHNPNAALANRDYAGGFAALAAMAPEIAAFFDKGGVMVMDPDPLLRKNRLSLLTEIAAPFAEVADFRKLGASS
jgi:glycyl-tRNA synthetase beta chain